MKRLKLLTEITSEKEKTNNSLKSNTELDSNAVEPFSLSGKIDRWKMKVNIWMEETKQLKIDAKNMDEKAKSMQSTNMRLEKTKCLEMLSGRFEKKLCKLHPDGNHTTRRDTTHAISGDSTLDREEAWSTFIGRFLNYFSEKQVDKVPCCAILCSSGGGKTHLLDYFEERVWSECPKFLPIRINFINSSNFPIMAKPQNAYKQRIIWE